MILNRQLYNKSSFLTGVLRAQQMRRMFREKTIFKLFKLHKTIWPDKIYFYSPRLKRKPQFSGDLEALRNWNNSQECEIICPTNAIKVTSKDIIIDHSGCIACGLCLEFAPPGLLVLAQKNQS